MADDEYKLIHAVDPTKKTNRVKYKYAKLTLSSNKKHGEEIEKPTAEQQKKRQSASRNLMDTICAESAKLYENPVLRSEPSSEGEIDWHLAETLQNTMLQTEGVQTTTRSFEDSEFMEPLQVSGDNFSQTLEEISQKVTNLSVNPATVPTNVSLSNVQQNDEAVVDASICISTSSDTNGDGSCITISDSTLHDENNATKSEAPVTSSMLISQHVNNNSVLPNLLDDEKLKRIEQYLRDVSFERHEMEQQGDVISELDKHKQLATADTETMSQTTESEPVPYDIDIGKLPSVTAAKETGEVDESKRLADDDTELNTIASDSENSFELKKPTNRSKLANDDPTFEESVTIPETSSEAETSENEKSVDSPISGNVSRQESKSSTESACIQMSNINISAKINIKIQVSNIESMSDSPKSTDGEDKSISEVESDESPARNSQQHRQQKGDSDKNNEKVQTEIEDGNFLSQAEDILNQLYGKSWQTPDVIRTLKRVSASEKKPTPLTEPKRMVPHTKPTTDKKQIKPSLKSNQNAMVEESMLADFSIFKRNICDKNLNSTHLAKSSKRQPILHAPPDPIANSPLEANKKHQRRNDRPNTILKPKTTNHQERWRQLIDNDSDTDDALASDDDELQATVLNTDEDSDSAETACSKSSSSSSDKLSRNEKKDSRSDRRKKLIYLDLTKEEVEMQEKDCATVSPPANNDAKFQKRLDDILRTCRREERPKLEATPKTGVKTKRQLFTPNVGYEDDVAAEELINNVRAVSDDLLEDLENVYPPGTPVHKRLQQIKKQLNAENDGNKKTPNKSELIFKPPATNSTTKVRTTPKSVQTPNKACRRLIDPCKDTPSRKYSFLKSLDSCIAKQFCNPEALHYRENYRTKKEELTQILYDLYNKDLFKNELSVPLTWNKKLTNTAGRCLNKRRLGNRLCVVELSEKVLTSADRLRCTLIHELCHAATWIFNGESGHGATWKMWAARANQMFPELPKIGVCHQYEIEYKYTYKCTLCAAKSHAHSKSKKVENIRCSYCHGAIEILHNTKDKEGNIVSKPVREATGFAKFVKDNYKRYKRPDLKHADVMKVLSNEFANIKVTSAS